MEYVLSQWQRYLRSSNPEFLWRIASNQDWLTKEETWNTCGQDLSDKRLAELKSQVQRLVEAA